MRTCDRCERSENWPGPMSLQLSLEGWHTTHIPGLHCWEFDLCKECATKLKNELNEFMLSFVGENLRRKK